MITSNIVLGETAHPQMSILILNQNHFYKRMMRASLHSYGFREIADCENLDSFLTRILAIRPDIILMDWSTEDFERPLLISGIRAGEIRGLQADCGIVITSSMQTKPELKPILSLPIDGLMLAPYSTKLIGRYVMRAAESVAERRKNASAAKAPERADARARFNLR